MCPPNVATATFSNVLTPLGARVRDALAWLRYCLAVMGQIKIPGDGVAVRTVSNALDQPEFWFNLANP